MEVIGPDRMLDEVAAPHGQKPEPDRAYRKIPRQSPSDPKGNGRYSEGVKGPDKPSPGHALFYR
jgi:hypothetical protein